MLGEPDIEGAVRERLLDGIATVVDTILQSHFASAIKRLTNSLVREGTLVLGLNWVLTTASNLETPRFLLADSSAGA